MRLRSGHVLLSICVVGLTFVAVAILMGTSVFTGNTTWEVGAPPLLAPKIYIEENMPAPVGGVASQTYEEINAQDYRRNPVKPVTPIETLSPNLCQEQSDALNYQSMEELKVSRKANEIAIRDNGIQQRLVTVGWIAIIIQGSLTLVQFLFILTANKHASNAAIAAKKSANSALLQTEIMENGERPWMMVIPECPKSWPPQGIRTDPFPFRFGWAAKNIGKSPAFLTRLSVETKIVDWPIPDERPTYPDTGIFAKFPLPPNGTYESVGRIGLTQLDIEGLINGQKALVFCGIIDYSGSFSGPHRTRFYSFWGGENGLKTLSPFGPPQAVEYT